MTAPREAIDFLSGKATLIEVLLVMAEGNTGACTVLGKLLHDKTLGLIDLIHLDEMNMRGEQIWAGFKYHCNEDMEAFRTAIRERDPAMIITVNRLCAESTGQWAREFLY